METDFTHFDNSGNVLMVKVGEKNISSRTASASCMVMVSQRMFNLIKSGGMKKGDVLAIARVAGIMGAKKTSDLIPLCHNVVTDGISLDIALDESKCCVQISASVSCSGRTGVEMEALTAVSVAALTVYDMCKAVQRDIVITDIKLDSKTGGSRGDFKRDFNA